MKKLFAPFIALFVMMSCSREERPQPPNTPPPSGIASIAHSLFDLPRTLDFRFEQSSTYRAATDNLYQPSRLSTDFFAYNFQNRFIGELLWHTTPLAFRLNHYYGNLLKSDSLTGHQRILSLESTDQNFPSFLYPLYAPMPMFFAVEGLTQEKKVDTLEGFTIIWPIDSMLPANNPVLLYTEFDIMGADHFFVDTLAEWDGEYYYPPTFLFFNKKKKIKVHLARGTTHIDTIGTKTAGFKFVHFGELTLDIR